MVTTQYFAMKTRRYQHEHGVSDRTLARISARAFRNGEAHPLAWRRTPLTEDEVLASAPVNEPLTQYMFCQPSQGAVALVLARGDRAGDLCDAPVRLAAVTQRTRRFGSFEVFSPWLSQTRGTARASTPPPPPSPRRASPRPTCRWRSCRTPTAARR